MILKKWQTKISIKLKRIWRPSRISSWTKWTRK